MKGVGASGEASGVMQHDPLLNWSPSKLPVLVADNGVESALPEDPTQREPGVQIAADAIEENSPAPSRSTFFVGGLR